MTQQIMLNTHSQKTNQVNTAIGNEDSNLLPITACEVNVIDLGGLSWLFVDEPFSKETKAGEI